MSPQLRDVFYLRGRLVRIIADLAGSANTEAYFTAMCDVAEFNRQYPTIAIPSAARVLGSSLLAVCADCIGEGSRSIDGDERICPSCDGSGYRGVSGFGAAAVRKLEVRSA